MTVCHVLREDPDLAEAVPPGLRAEAVGACVTRTLQLPRGGWNPAETAAIGTGIGLLVLDGLLLRRVGVDGRFGAELLGEGDLLRPWQGEDTTPALTRTTRWRVLQPVRLALLDHEAARCFSVYPELTGRFVARALDRSRNLTVNMAIVHQARVNMRLQMLFWHLADRWGRVTAEGVMLPLNLTHQVLADLVGARRPTVSTSLSELSREGRVAPLRYGWMLSGDPPGELLAVQEIEIAGG